MKTNFLGNPIIDGPKPIMGVDGRLENGGKKYTRKQAQRMADALAKRSPLFTHNVPGTVGVVFDGGNYWRLNVAAMPIKRSS